jgi:addiction module HigA family antidote
MLPTHRAPTKPGEILREEFLVPLGLTQERLAAAMGVHVQQVNVIVRGRRSITAHTAILLGHVLGTTPEFWLNAQQAVDLWEAQKTTKLPTSKGLPLHAE